MEEGIKKLENKLAHKSLIVLIIGKRGSGKSVLGFKLLEKIHQLNTDKKIYALGVNTKAKLPKWIHTIKDVNQARPNCIILIDEGGISFNARRSMNKANVFLQEAMAVSRHNDQTLIFITQYTATIDVNILRFADIKIVKEPSRDASRWERGAIKTWLADIQRKFEDIQPEDRIKHYFVDSEEYEGLVKTGLPTFWTEEISKSFRKVEVDIPEFP